MQPPSDKPSTLNQAIRIVDYLLMCGGEWFRRANDLSTSLSLQQAASTESRYYHELQRRVRALHSTLSESSLQATITVPFRKGVDSALAQLPDKVPRSVASLRKVTQSFLNEVGQMVETLAEFCTSVDESRRFQRLVRWVENRPDRQLTRSSSESNSGSS